MDQIQMKFFSLKLFSKHQLCFQNFRFFRNTFEHLDYYSLIKLLFNRFFLVL